MLPDHADFHKPRVPWATDPRKTRGRVFVEEESPTRSSFQRDRDRIIHSGAFRRLKYKTQVFVYHEGDHFRTRLTHSLEVAQIARSLSRFLGLNEDLAEALALAHDLGHTPFGHAGEDALNDVMEPWGGFDHNGQALRIVTELEARYADFDGLNLTWETLEGLVKHNGPLIHEKHRVEDLPWSIRAYSQYEGLELESQPGMEAQVAALADDIAYNTHDIDDGLRAGLFSVADLADLPLVGPVIRDVSDRYPDLEQSRLIHESTRRMIDRMVSDLLGETESRLDRHKPQSIEDVRGLNEPVVAMSEAMFSANADLKAFLFERMYRHYRVNRMTSKARRIVSDLFQAFLEEPECLPTDWRERLSRLETSTDRARMISDYIAGMTDRFALEEHKRLFSTYDKDEYFQ